MGTLSNLFDVLRDNSYREIEDEASREVAIALAGNTTEGRDKLHRALSTRLESLWTASPFRLIESSERPTLSEDDEGGLLLYSLYQGERIPAEKRRWLSELTTSRNVSIIITTLDQQSGEAFERNARRNRLQSINPLRLVGGREAKVGSAAADGAAFNSAEAQMRPAWQTELEELVTQGNGKITTIGLTSLELAQLETGLLPAIVERLEGRELALARRAPVFRNAVASHLIARTARSNAELVLLANVTAGIPILSGFFSSGADFVVLTKNQFELSHRLAGVYGQKRENRVEVYLELAPIVLAGLAWKALSIMAAKKLPPLISMLPKAGIAFAATMIVGRLAQLYYASGRKAPAQVSAFVRGLYEQATGRTGAGPGSDAGDTPRQLRSS